MNTLDNTHIEPLFKFNNVQVSIILYYLMSLGILLQGSSADNIWSFSFDRRQLRFTLFKIVCNEIDLCPHSLTCDCITVAVWVLRAHENITVKHTGVCNCSAYWTCQHMTRTSVAGIKTFSIEWSHSTMDCKLPGPPEGGQNALDSRGQSWLTGRGNVNWQALISDIECSLTWSEQWIQSAIPHILWPAS